MQRKWRRALALALAFCTVLSLCVPMTSSAADTETALTYQDYFNRGYGPVTYLGEPLCAAMNFWDCGELLEYDDKQYLLVPAAGGIFYVFRLSEFIAEANKDGGNLDQSWIYDEVNFGNHFRSIVCDPYHNGIAYISDSTSTIYVYDISKRSTVAGIPTTLGKISVGAATRHITMDDEGNLYVTARDCKVYKITDPSSETPTVEAMWDLSGEIVDMAGIVYADGYVYASGNKEASDGRGSYTYKLDPDDTTGYKARYYYSAEGGFTYLSYAGGLIFAGNTTSCGKMVILDADDLTETAIPMKLRILNTDENGSKIDSTKAKYLELTDEGNEVLYNDYYEACYSQMSMAGMVTEQRGDYIYFVTNDTYDGIDSDTDADGANDGYWRFNIAAWEKGSPEPAEHVSYSNSAKDDNHTTAFRVRDPYVTVKDTDSDDTSTYILTFSHETLYLWWIENSNPDNTVAAKPSDVKWSSMLTGATTTEDTRSISVGIGDAAVYVGSYLSPTVASYDPTAEVPISYPIFNHGISQTDAMLVYKDTISNKEKLYVGAYNGAYLVQYDPTTNTVTQLIPEGLKTGYGQARIHALAAGDNKIFFSTIPADQLLGGVVGWYDLETGETKVIGELEVTKTEDKMEIKDVVNEPVEKQSIISLVYDEDKDILYGTSSKFAATNTGSDHLTEGEAVIWIYDVAEEKELGEFSIRDMELLDEDSVQFPDAATGQPIYIDGIAQDPDGKLWGVVDQTIFSFTYDETDGFSAKEEITGDKTTQTVNSGNTGWFPRPFLFDSEGRMYVYLAGENICRYTLTDGKLTEKTDLGIATRSYALGNDGNLYAIVSGAKWLKRVSLNEHSIVEDLITAATIDDPDSITQAQAAYDSLDEEEKGKVSSYSVTRLAVLQNAECEVENSEGISYSTVADAMASADANTTVRLLADYEGSITVQNGAVLDLAGKTVDGNVSVVAYGAVMDSSEGAGSIKKLLDLEEATSLPQMPLLDTDGAYHFYAYDTELLATDKVTNDEGQEQINFWFDLEFTDDYAQLLMTDGRQSHIDIEAELTVETVNGEKILKTIVWNDTQIQDCAIDQYNEGKDHAFYLAATNITEDVSYLYVKPTFTVCGYTGEFLNSAEENTLTRDVRVPRGIAIYGAWPTDLMN